MFCDRPDCNNIEGSRVIDSRPGADSKSIRRRRECISCRRRFTTYERVEEYELVVIKKDGATISEEGCLSVPNSYAKVDRAETVTVAALNENGEEFVLDADELLAICIQHELDHLQGKLFIDYLSPLKRQRIRKKLEKEAKFAAK